MSDAAEQNAGRLPGSFEEQLASLEQIVHELEEGQIGLEDSLARYEEGVKLLKACHQILQRTERRIEVLTGVDAAGNPITQEFDEPVASKPKKARAPKAVPVDDMDAAGGLF